jgi:hypothetical protein
MVDFVFGPVHLAPVHPIQESGEQKQRDDRQR